MHETFEQMMNYSALIFRGVVDVGLFEFYKLWHLSEKSICPSPVPNSKCIFPTSLYFTHILRFPVALNNPLTFLKR
jgi:hypothetical protein